MSPPVTRCRQSLHDYAVNVTNRFLPCHLAGDFDASFMFGELAKVLGIEERRIRMVVKELVGSRRRMTLVQAVSQLRQKRPGDAVTSLNNLLSAVRASPEEGPVQWNERSELNDLFGVYCAKVGGHGGPVMRVRWCCVLVNSGMWWLCTDLQAAAVPGACLLYMLHFAHISIRQFEYELSPAASMAMHALAAVIDTYMPTSVHHRCLMRPSKLSWPSCLASARQSSRRYAQHQAKLWMT